MRSESWTIIIFGLLFAVFISSCTGSEQALDQNAEAANSASESPAVPNVDDTVAGPSVLNLDDPGLYQYRDKDFSTSMRFEYEGESSGNVTIDGEWYAGATPGYSFTFDTSLSMWADVVPFTYIGMNGVQYLLASYTGCSAETEDLENPYDDYFINGPYLTGDVPLVESGIEINGTIVDRYEVTHENQGSDEGSAFYDFEFLDTQGSVYVDRVSGAIVRLEQTGAGVDNSMDSESPQEVDIDFQLDFVLNPDRPDLVLPENCESVDPGSMAEEPAGVSADVPLPILDDAMNISTQADLGIYEYDTLYDFDAIVSFYHDELVALGYAVDNELAFSPTALLQYSTDQESVVVSVNENKNGDGFSVSLVYSES